MSITKDQAMQNILNRLNQFGGFHPATANLFTDWTLEPGDIITVKSGETDYSVPVYQYDLDWKGGTIVAVQSTGSKKRPDPSKLNRGGGYGGNRREEEIDQEAVRYETRLGKTETTVYAYAGAMGIALDQDGNPLIDENGKYVYDNEGNNSIFAQLELKPNKASLISEINNASGTIAAGRVEVQPGSVLIQAINGGTGHSNIRLEADTVDIDGFITAMQTKDLWVTNFDAYNGEFTGSLTVDENLIVLGDITVGDVTGEDATFDSVTIGGSTLGGDLIVNASVNASTNTLTLTKANGQTVNFSKAIAPTIGGGWDNGVYTVTSDITPAPGSVTATTLFDLGLGTPSLGTGSTVEATYDIGYAAIVSGQQVRGGTTGMTGTLSLNVSSLLTTATVAPGGTVTAGSGSYANYIGFTSVTASGEPTPVIPRDVRSLAVDSSRITYTQGSHVYALGADITYDDGDTGTSSMNVSVQVGNYTANTGAGSYAINVAGNTEQTFIPTEAYNAGVSAGTSLDLTDVSLTAGVAATPSVGAENHWFSDVSITKSCDGLTSDTDTVSVDVQNAVNVGVQTGWDAMKASIEMDPASPTTVASGSSITVSVKGLANPSATAKSVLASITVTGTGGTTRTATRVNVSPIYDGGHVVGSTWVVRYNNGTSTTITSTTAVPTSYTS